MILRGAHSLHIASPYMNFTHQYLSQLLGYEAVNDRTVCIMTSSPTSNGWYKASGLASFITPLYCEIERMVFKAIQKSMASKHVTLYEYSRQGWSYHSKGMWATACGQEFPYFTLIGSSNFGRRSVEKDLESQVAVLTTNLELRKKMDEERKQLWLYSQKVDSTLLNSSERKSNPFVKLLLHWVRQYM